MKANSAAGPATRLLLVIIAVAIGIAVVLMENVAHAAFTGRELMVFDEPAGFLYEAAGVALPFFLLAVLGIRNIKPWLAGLLLTLLFWGWLVYDSATAWGTGRGANIGLGLAMLASPLIITAICLALAWKTDAKRAKP